VTYENILKLKKPREKEAMIDPDILSELSEDEIVLLSQELVIQDIEEAEENEGEGKCRRKRPLANFLNGKY
jgi:hypothetical protein